MYVIVVTSRTYHDPLVLRCHWLGGRKGIRPVKNWVVGCWHGFLSGASCRLAYVSADATATHCLLLPCFSKIHIGFTFLVLVYPGSPGKRAVKRVCACVRACVRVRVCVCMSLWFDCIAVGWIGTWRTQEAGYGSFQCGIFTGQLHWWNILYI